MSLFAAAAFIPAFCQQYTPRETWPFIYEEFQEGSTRTLNGDLITEARFNISANGGKLLYVGKDNIIMIPNMSNVYAAKVGKDVYVNIEGRMYLLLSELDCGLVVCGYDVDVDKMAKADIGYGKSSVASTQRLSLLAIDGGSMTNKSLDSMATNKYEGQELPLKQTYYLYYGKTLTRATRQEVMKIPGIDSKSAKDFFKQEKIRWKDSASLEKVLVFINSQIFK